MKNAWVVAWVSMVLVACGGGSGAEDGGAADARVADGGFDSSALDAFLMQAATRRCQGALSCMVDEVERSQSLGTEEHCVAAVLGELRNHTITIAEAAASGQVRFDASESDACLAALERQGCEEHLSLPISGFPWPAECASVIAGTLAAGESCQIDEECMAGSCACGTCVAYASEGESCASAQCGPGLRCADGTCAPALHAGDACTQDFPEDVAGDCPPNLYCVEGTCHEGTDFRTATEGQTCYSPRSYTDPRVYCADGLDCYFATAGEGTCVVPHAANDPCEGGTTGLCPDDMLCHGPSDDLRCRAYLGEGAECFPSGWGDPCAPGMICAPGDSVCRPLADNGESCTGDFDCFGGFCNAGTCAASANRYCG